MFSKRERYRNFFLGRFIFSKLKGFTLAEILIVLTVIGVIATITIPQLTGGVEKARYKAGIKKAYTTLYQIAEIEKREGRLPQTASKDGMISFFNALNTNLNVDGYAEAKRTRIVHKPNEIKGGIKWQGIQFGDEDDSIDYNNEEYSPWIITADGMAFIVTVHYSSSCEKRSKLNAATTFDDYSSKSCLGFLVDVNGVTKGPNTAGDQATWTISSSEKLKLAFDQYLIFLGNDGIAKGSPIFTITGRILAGED